MDVIISINPMGRMWRKYEQVLSETVLFGFKDLVVKKMGRIP
jgi:hypothetical protein